MTLAPHCSLEKAVNNLTHKQHKGNPISLLIKDR